VQQRYAMVAVPAALLLRGRGFEVLASVRPRARALGLALVAPAPQLLAYACDGDRADWRAAATWLGAHAQPDDILVADEHAMLDLYCTLPGWEQGTSSTRRARGLESKDAPKLRGFPRDRHQVWVVLKANRRGGDVRRGLRGLARAALRAGAPRSAPVPPALTRHDNRLAILRARRACGP
jgi:hypothetical protein